MYTFWEDQQNLPKIGGRTLHGLKQICYIFTRYPLDILSQFWHPCSTYDIVDCKIGLYLSFSCEHVKLYDVWILYKDAVKALKRLI